MHNHSITEDCTTACPRHNPEAWACGKCGRQRPMAADTEEWPVPLCDLCFDDVLEPAAVA